MSTQQRNIVTLVAGTKLAIFTIISIIVTGTLAAIMGNFGFGSQTDYRAMFTSASMLEAGDDVRIAGVSVGEVKDVEIKDRNHALVTFRVKSDVPMTTASRAEIRFLNLVGSRYLAIMEGQEGAPELPEKATIPITQTSPALNLTELFNGFQPLFQALNPNEINDLSMNLIRVLQGEGGTIQSLLGNTASLTNALADRDELVGQVVDNLSTMLGTVDARHEQLNTLVVELKNWLTNVAADRETIGASLTNISSLARELSALLTEGRPYLKDDIKHLSQVLKVLNRQKNQEIVSGTIDRLLDLLPRQTRVGSYGSWYNYYLCDFTGEIILPNAIKDLPGIAQIQAQLRDLAFHSNATRCKL